MVKKLFILVTLVLLLGVTSVTAVFFEQNTDIDLRHSVRVQDAITSTATCNITIFDPDDTVLVGFQGMTFDSFSQTYNYTLNNTATAQFGAYSYDITCVDNGFNKTLTFNFNVNPAGRDFTTAESLLFIFILLISLTFFGLTLFFSIRIPFRNERDFEGKLIKVNFAKHIKLLLITATYTIFVWLTWVTWHITAGFVELTGVSLFFLHLHRASISFLWPAFVVILMWILVTFLLDLKIDKALKEGRIFHLNEF